MEKPHGWGECEWIGFRPLRLSGEHGQHQRQQKIVPLDPRPFDTCVVYFIQALPLLLPPQVPSYHPHARKTRLFLPKVCLLDVSLIIHLRPFARPARAGWGLQDLPSQNQKSSITIWRALPRNTPFSTCQRVKCHPQTSSNGRPPSHKSEPKCSMSPFPTRNNRAGGLKHILVVLHRVWRRICCNRCCRRLALVGLGLGLEYDTKYQQVLKGAATIRHSNGDETNIRFESTVY